MHRFSAQHSRAKTGFTLVEMLAAIAVLLIILTVIFSIMQQITKAWHRSVGKVENLRDARAAFTAMTHTISQATLNTYYDYYGTDSSGAATFRTSANSANFTPTGYLRQSDLHFISGNTATTLLNTVSQIQYPTTHAIFFQAPLGATDTSGYQQLNSTLNACGFYVNYGPDPTVPTFLSPLVPVHYRYRLMQFTQPTEGLSIYDSQTMGTAASTYTKWYLGPLGQDLSQAATSQYLTTLSQLAQNVVALIILPKLSAADQKANSNTELAPSYNYDSRDATNATKSVTYNQLPPIVEVTMVVMDEASALKLGNTATPPPNLSQGANFTIADNLSADLKILEDNLAANPGNQAGNKIPLTFQVFQSEVPINGAKWSSTSK